ncbi:dual specificity protein phosphatase family protein [Candidatus Uhrbacteria bacterium]|nr:dual specificity protein phosphatase family protein [Candidatus Uhrbacteria bacterium]
MPNREPKHPIFEYSQITDQIFIGTNACCQMHFKQELLDKGVSRDISLESEMIDQPYGVETFVWLPTPDKHPPSSDNVKIGTVALSEMLAQGQKIYIHCKNGHGRAPTFFAAFLISRGMSADQALGLIKAKRPSIHLEQGQLDFLEDFGKT